MVRQVKNLKRQELLVEYFTKCQGCSINQEKTTRKYTCIDSPSGTDRFFLGPSGAVRKGRSVSDSLSITHRFDETRLEQIRSAVQEARDQQKAQK